jgi:hypothetical protein
LSFSKIVSFTKILQEIPHVVTRKVWICLRKLGKPGFPTGTTVAASHRNGSKGSEEAREGKLWEVYPKAQLQALFDMVSLLIAKYDVHDVTGQTASLPGAKPTPTPAPPSRC